MPNPELIGAGLKPRTGPVPRGNDYRLMIYLTEEEEALLRDYCERENCTRATAVRRGLRALP